MVIRRNQVSGIMRAVINGAHHCSLLSRSKKRQFVMMEEVQGYDIGALFQEARKRWLRPAEVLYILRNHEKYQFTDKPPQRPAGGSLYLFNKRVLRFFRRDGHNWRKKKDGRTVGEAHERLKVADVEALNCYYAHGEDDPDFQRRSYWMLDPKYEHVVLVHYRETKEGRSSSGSVASLSPGASSILSPSSHSTYNPSEIFVVRDFHEPHQTLSSPASIEVSSEIVSGPNGVDRQGNLSSSLELQVIEALQGIEKQLSLNRESFQEFGSFGYQETEQNNSELLEYEKKISEQNQCAGSLPNTEEYGLHNRFYGKLPLIQDPSDNLVQLQDAENDVEHYHQSSYGHRDGSEKSLSWNEELAASQTTSTARLRPEEQFASPKRELTDEEEYSHWPSFKETSATNYPVLMSQEIENFNFDALVFPSQDAVTSFESFDPYAMLFDQSEMPLEVDSKVTIALRERFKIQVISPEWGYTNEITKVVVVGSFLCDPAESLWTFMFGDIEVPVKIIQDGVFCCEAPPHPPGKVTVYLTAGNRESCSELREFEYRDNASSCTHCYLSHTEATSKSPEELLLLVRFVQMLLSVSCENNVDSSQFENLNAGDDLWSHVIDDLLVGNGTTSGTVDWLMQELLKEKLSKWLASRAPDNLEQGGCCFSKKDQGIIHMIAGLGYEWAVNPILSHGVSVDFRDINGWTALHWAARFGREKMVAVLIASGASAGAVTDPTVHDLTGKTAASVAAINGHKGLAGYLSNVALTSHLSSLAVEESELSKGPAETHAEMAVNNISNEYFGTCKDQLSLEDTLAAVRNATQAAARIQSAFRAHSFQKRLQREAGAGSINEYGVDIQELSAISKLTFGNPREYNSAALSIQKKYRGWKGRKDYLAFRQKVVKIQAHVRGYQVRNQYKLICWAVGILDKAILRWRRNGVGLRGFQNETSSIDHSEEDDDILKVFRKQKVDAAVAEAVSRVVSMVQSSEARQQYHRMLEKYRQAKANRGEGNGSTSLGGDVYDMERDDDILNYLL